MFLCFYFFLGTLQSTKPNQTKPIFFSDRHVCRLCTNKRSYPNCKMFGDTISFGCPFGFPQTSTSIWWKPNGQPNAIFLRLLRRATTRRSSRTSNIRNWWMDSPHLLLPFPLGPPPTRALSLAECFTEGHLNLRKWTQRNVSLSAMARWRTSFALQSFGGINGGTETDINEEDRPKKRRAQRGVYRYKGNKDDPVKIIPPEESTWYKMYVTNFLMLEDDPMCQRFRERFRLP